MLILSVTEAVWEKACCILNTATSVAETVFDTGMLGSNFIPSTADKLSLTPGTVTSKAVDSTGDAVSLRPPWVKFLAVDSVILDVSVKPLSKSNSLILNIILS